MDSLSELRLRLKRAFSLYYLDLCSSSIADPSESFAACRAYLAAWSRTSGPEAFRNGLEEEVDRLAGEIEQDIRQRHKDMADCFAAEPLFERFREIVEQSRGAAEA